MEMFEIIKNEKPYTDHIIKNKLLYIYALYLLSNKYFSFTIVFHRESNVKHNLYNDILIIFIFFNIFSILKLI